MTIFQGQRSSLLQQRILLSRLTTQQDQSRGFTLTELLVVIIIVSVLFGIAAPGWLGFMNRQRVSGAKTEVLQVLREAQKLAITKRGTYSVRVSDDTPEVFILSGDGAGNTPLKTYTIGKRDGGKADVALTTLPIAAGNTVIFNFDGSIRSFGTSAAPVDSNADGSLYKVVVSPENGANPRSCVLVDTILGAMSEGSGSDCDA